MYLADLQFDTGLGNSQLHIRGSVVGRTSISLSRDLADNSLYAAEIFEYGIDQAFFFPLDLGSQRILWKEVAP